MTPPPAGSGPGATPTDPQAASPAPPTPSPVMQQGMKLIVDVVTNLRAIAKAYPAAAPKVAEANSVMREISALMMQSQHPGEPSAPPSGG